MLTTLITAVLLSQPADYTRRDAPRDAAAAALLDVSSTPRDRLHVLPYYRYVWCHTGTDADVGATILAVHTAVSYSSQLLPPKIIPLKTSKLLRFNLDDLADNDTNLKHIVKIWELLVDNEAYFHRRLDKTPYVKIKVAPYLATDGRTYDYKYERKEVKIEFSIAAGGAGPLLPLADLCKTKVPIVRDDYLRLKILTTADVGFGEGLYYKFRRFNGAKLGDLFKQVGVDLKLSEKFRADRAALILTSKITHKPRKIVFMPALASGLEGAPVIMTEDTQDKQTDADNDPFRNILEHRFAAREVFLPLLNRLVATVLTDAEGNVQDEAPPDVAQDALAGRGTSGTRRLQGGPLSCGRCHISESGSWYQPVENDLQTLVKRGGLDILDDLTDKRKGQREILERIRSLYQWEPELHVLPDSRDKYDSALFQAVGQYFPKDSTRAVWTHLGEGYNRYVYDGVTAADALHDLGYEVPKEKAAGFLARNFNFAPDQRADPTLGLLRAGKAVHRWQWELILADVAFGDIITPPPEIPKEALPKEAQPREALPASSKKAAAPVGKNRFVSEASPVQGPLGPPVMWTFRVPPGSQLRIGEWDTGVVENGVFRGSIRPWWGIETKMIPVTITTRDQRTYRENVEVPGGRSLDIDLRSPQIARRF